MYLGIDHGFDTSSTLYRAEEMTHIALETYVFAACLATGGAGK